MSAPRQIDLADAELPEVEEHEAVELSAPAAPGEALALSVGGLALEPFLRPGESRWRWRWSPGAAVGDHRLTLETPAGRRQLTLRVAPRKIDRERYELLLDDLRASARELLFALGGGAEGAGLDPAPPEPRGALAAYYALFEERLGPLERAVQRIDARPRERLGAERRTVDLGLAREIDPSFAPDEPLPAAGEGGALQLGGAPLPARTRERGGRPSLDTYEHRLARRLLESLARRARALAEAAGDEAARPSASPQRAAEARRVAEGCRAAGRRLQALRALPLFDGVGELEAYRGPTPLLQREPPYREVYRAWAALRRSPAVDLAAPLFRLPVAELPRLYEAWCALRAALALRSLGGEVRGQRLLEGEPEPRPRVEPGALLTVALAGWELTLRYQPRYRPGDGRPGALGSLDRHVRVPDLAVEARGPGDALRVLVLDAKYRLDPDGRHVPQDALADAYAYRAAIGRAGRSAVDAAILLYPGAGAPERYESGVGALPLLPGATEPLADLLADWWANRAA